MFHLKNNFSIPKVLLGTYLITEQEDVDNSLGKAISSGYRGLDTAAFYKNEKQIGNFLKSSLSKYNLKREDIFITSKLDTSDHGYEKAKAAIKTCLENFQLDYIDLYLIHFPGTYKLEKSSPVNLENRKGSWKALEEAKESGCIRYIGVSNYMIKHLEEMKEYASILPVVNQVECHPYLNQHELIEYCRQNDIHFQAYSSLGTTAKHNELIENETVKKIASEVHKSPAQVLLKWALKQGLSVLPKSTNPKHIESNIQLFDWDLSDSQMSELFALDKDYRFCWNPHIVA